MTVALALAGVALLIRPLPISRVPPPQTRDIVLVAELVGLGLSSGMNLQHSLAWASRYCHPALRCSIRGLLRRARLHGLAAAMRAFDGPLTDVFRSLARGVETGAALGSTADSIVDSLTSQARADAAARAQRLPVKLLFPLAFLMLPGLVLVVAGPALIDVFARLSAVP